eukprot:9286545-Alexandrium_andersonii.AAC.1
MLRGPRVLNLSKMLPDPAGMKMLNQVEQRFKDIGETTKDEVTAEDGQCNTETQELAKTDEKIPQPKED